MAVAALTTAVDKNGYCLSGLISDTKHNFAIPLITCTVSCAIGALVVTFAMLQRLINCRIII